MVFLLIIPFVVSSIVMIYAHMKTKDNLWLTFKRFVPSWVNISSDYHGN